MKKCCRCGRRIENNLFAVYKNSIFGYKVLCNNCIIELNRQLFTEKKIGVLDFLPSLVLDLKRICNKIHSLGDYYCNSEGHMVALNIIDELHEFIEKNTADKILKRITKNL